MPETDYKEKMRRIIQIIAVIIMCSIVGCKSHSVALSESVRITDSVRWETRYRDSVVIQKVLKDSVRIKDSVIVSVDSLGNRTTDRWHTHVQYVTNDAQIEIYQAKIDSLERIKRKDSIVYEKVEVPTMSKLQKLQVQLARLVLGIGCIVFLIWMVYRKFKSK